MSENKKFAVVVDFPFLQDHNRFPGQTATEALEWLFPDKAPIVAMTSAEAFEEKPVVLYSYSSRIKGLYNKENLKKIITESPKYGAMATAREVHRDMLSLEYRIFEAPHTDIEQKEVSYQTVELLKRLASGHSVLSSVNEEPEILSEPSLSSVFAFGTYANAPEKYKSCVSFVAFTSEYVSWFLKQAKRERGTVPFTQSGMEQFALDLVENGYHETLEAFLSGIPVEDLFI